MNEQSREAIADIRKSWRSGYSLRPSCVDTVIEAWLVEHPDDDETLVDAEWLQSVGLTNQWYDDTWGTNQYSGRMGIAICVPSGGVMICNGDSITAPDGLVCPTRGDVRRLARALRVELGDGR